MLESGKRERAGPIARGCTFDLRVNRETLVGARLQCNRNPLNRLPSHGIDYTPGNWWNHLSSNNEKFGKYHRAQEEQQNNLTADSVMDIQCGKFLQYAVLGGCARDTELPSIRIAQRHPVNVAGSLIYFDQKSVPESRLDRVSRP